MTTNTQERGKFVAWSEVHYRNAERYSQRDYAMGLEAWMARASLPAPPAVVGVMTDEQAFIRQFGHESQFDRFLAASKRAEVLSRHPAKIPEDDSDMRREQAWRLAAIESGNWLPDANGFPRAIASHPAKTVLETHAAMEQAHQYVTDVAALMAEKFYPEVTQWKPLPDLLGVITQIDNMTAGLMRATPPSASSDEQDARTACFLRSLAESLRQSNQYGPLWNPGSGYAHKLANECEKHATALSTPPRAEAGGSSGEAG